MLKSSERPYRDVTPLLLTRSYKKWNLPSFQLPPEVIEDKLESEEEEEEEEEFEFLVRSYIFSLTFS